MGAKTALGVRRRRCGLGAEAADEPAAEDTAALIARVFPSLSAVSVEGEVDRAQGNGLPRS